MWYFFVVPFFKTLFEASNQKHIQKPIDFVISEPKLLNKQTNSDVLGLIPAPLYQSATCVEETQSNSSHFPPFFLFIYHFKTCTVE